MLILWRKSFLIFISLLCLKVKCEYPQGDAYSRESWATVGSWFLGPKAENVDEYKEFLDQIIASHTEVRQNTYKWDAPSSVRSIKNTESFQSEISQTRTELGKILDELKNSVPFYSMRYQGHMSWDTTMPAQLGYFAAMLYNQNNVAAEGSPVTTKFEIEVGEQLCEMLGYNPNPTETLPPQCWAHITAGGTISNIEAGWAARNLKYFPVAVSYLAQKNYPSECSDFFIKTITNETKLLKNLSKWDLLNLDLDVVSTLYEDFAKHIAKKRNLVNAEELKAEIDEKLTSITIQKLGLVQFKEKHGMSLVEMSPKILIPATRHYSWPKMATLLGLGDASVVDIKLDQDAHINITNLREKLEYSLKNKEPIMMVVGVVGTTEESSVDPISKIVEIRDEYRIKGLNFWIHADAAWGAYYRTLINITKPNAQTDRSNSNSQFVPVFPVNDYTKKQLEALPSCDSVTLDPHKSGYIQYPAGALAYRNIQFRNFVTITAPVIFRGGTDPTVGIYGVEGSKPGAAPTAVLLSHRVIGLDEHGYGKILGQAMYGAKLFYSMWIAVAEEEDPFACFPMKPLPDTYTMTYAKTFIRQWIFGKNIDGCRKELGKRCMQSNEGILANQDIIDFLHEIGPDTSINAFACNFKVRSTGAMNRDVSKANEYNDCLFNHLSHSNLDKDVSRARVLLTNSKKNPKVFGKAVAKVKNTMGLDNVDGDDNLHFLINTVMNPLQSSERNIESIAEGFRETALICYGKVNDPTGYHGFVVVGEIEDDYSFYGDHLSVFSIHKHQYQGILKFKLKGANANAIKRKISDLHDKDKTKPVIIINKLNTGGLQLHDIAFGQGRTSDISFDVFHGFNTLFENKPELTDVTISTEDVVHFNHFGLSAPNFDEFWKKNELKNQLNPNFPDGGDVLQYLMFGSKTQSFVTKINDGHFPDIHHIQVLDHNKTQPRIAEEILEHGLTIKIVHPNEKTNPKEKYCKKSKDRYLQAIIDSPISEYCDRRQGVNLNPGSCLTSLRAPNYPAEHTNYGIEYSRAFGGVLLGDLCPAESDIYVKEDIWFDTIQINANLADVCCKTISFRSNITEYAKFNGYYEVIGPGTPGAASSNGDVVNFKHKNEDFYISKEKSTVKVRRGDRYRRQDRRHWIMGTSERCVEDCSSGPNYISKCSSKWTYAKRRTPLTPKRFDKRSDIAIQIKCKNS